MELHLGDLLSLELAVCLRLYPELVQQGVRWAVLHPVQPVEVLAVHLGPEQLLWVVLWVGVLHEDQVGMQAIRLVVLPGQVHHSHQVVVQAVRLVLLLGQEHHVVQLGQLRVSCSR